MPTSQPTHRFRVGDPVQVERANPPAIRAHLTTFAARAASSPCCMARLSIRSTTAVSIRLCAACSSGCAMCSAAVVMTRCRSTCTRIGSCPPALATSRLWTDLLSVSMSALGQKQTCAVQLGVSALGQKQYRKRSCPLYPRKRTCAVQLGMSALGQKRTWDVTTLDRLVNRPTYRTDDAVCGQ
jgi:hypothetical protein